MVRCVTDQPREVPHFVRDDLLNGGSVSFMPLQRFSDVTIQRGKHSDLSSAVPAGPEQSQSAEDRRCRSTRFQSGLVCLRDGW
jgi:hypothetical protein